MPVDYHPIRFRDAGAVCGIHTVLARVALSTSPLDGFQLLKIDPKLADARSWTRLRTNKLQHAVDHACNTLQL